MKTWGKRLAIGVVVVLAAVLAAIALAGGFVIKHSVNTLGPKLMGVPVRLGGATLNPATGHLTLKELHIGNPDGFRSASLFDMARLDIRLRMRSLFSDKIVIENIEVSGPELTYERSLKTSNLDQLMKKLEPESKASAKEKEPAQEKPSRKTIIRELSIDGTRVHVALSALGGHGLTLPLPPVRLSNIGGKEDGVTFTEAVKQILAALFQSVQQAVRGSGKVLGEGAAAVGEGAAKAGEALSEGAGKAVESLKGLLK